MSLITLRNLGVTLGLPLFSGLNLSVNAADRIGLVAANGRGKSTLLRLIAGALEPGEGEITRARGLTVGHVEQNVPPALMAASFRDAVLAALSADQAENEGWRADVVLEMLEVPEAFRGRPLSQLSGGWQRLALLARTWVNEPDVLLLDEPTNHLDLSRILQLEGFLNALPRGTAVIAASHDRAFLDAVTNRTLFLRPQTSPVFALAYSPARAALDAADAADERQYARDMKQAAQLRQQAAKLNNIGINSGSDLLVVKTKQLKQRAERLEDAAKPAHLERSAGAIRLANRATHAKVLVTLEDAAISTPDGTALFRTGRQFICQGDRIVLLGANGTGKTRLVNALRASVERAAIEGAAVDRAAVERAVVAGAAVPGTAGIRATPSLVLGYGDQALADLADVDTPLLALTRRFALGEQRARSLLAGAGIAIEKQGQPLGRLSGGQKARLGMLVLRLAEPNFYLLDEPTNHLDIEGQETLEKELMSQQTTCLFVSHDRRFVRAVANRFWRIDRRRLIEVEDAEGFFAQAGGPSGV